MRDHSWTSPYTTSTRPAGRSTGTSLAAISRSQAGVSPSLCVSALRTLTRPAGEFWETMHANASHAAGKPVVLEEFGYPGVRTCLTVHSSVGVPED
jgi:hypothetical protein